MYPVFAIGAIIGAILVVIILAGLTFWIYRLLSHKVNTPGKKSIARFGFYAHAAGYTFINVFITLFNILFDPSHIWFYYILISWGVGLLIHAILAFRVKDEAEDIFP